MENEMVKVTVNLPRRLYEALEEISQSRRVTKTQALRQAIGTEKFLREEVEKGSKILIEDKNKKYREIILR